MKKYYVSLQAIGDNLISLSLLSQMQQSDINVLGTQHTVHIANLIRLNINIKVVFDDIPAFYHIKKKGVLKAIVDILKFRRYVTVRGIKILIFEKKDFRTHLLTIGLGIKSYSSNKYTNIYKNRRYLIEKFYQRDIHQRQLTKNYFFRVRSILIGPVTRLKSRNITPSNLDALIKLFKEYGIRVQLLDYDSSYKKYKDKVDEYFYGTSLEDVKVLISKSDLFIGADSFLVHLAYYLKKPFFIIYNRENFDFLPPGCQDLKNYILIKEQTNFAEEVELKFKSLGVLD